MSRDLNAAFRCIRQFEGCRLHAYQDSVGVWTIGYGTTLGVHPGMVITLPQAESLMEIDVQHRAKLLSDWIQVPVSDNALAAMISLAYNIGMSAFYHSSLLHHLNSGSPMKVVAEDFLKWTHAGGHVIQGLVNRRKQERAIFLS